MESVVSAVHISNLTFRYPGNDAASFTDMNLQVNKGDRFGLFGPNGAGKTTLMNIMTGLIKADGGTVALNGVKVDGHKFRVNHMFGFVPQDFSLYQELSPKENLEFFGAWYGLDRQTIKQRTDELLTVMDLQDVRNKQVQLFSGGMKRRVNLAIGVIHNPSIIFLDEPTVGVDVQTRHAIVNYLLELNSKGTTLIYTSHQLSEAQDLCNQVAMMDQGKIVAHDSLDNLLHAHEQEDLEALFLNLTGKKFRDDV
ncbi:ABC transporter ATP-binding protein [Mucilaginibacter myungsuensis]|uniref:ABC transporter ATP-binding protein n=1 Tax=Mucilaginibacter myungsuensis TaxID=649104 RepID=A0A929KX95_9SPHI|nr:ABC transporter ATP-binding protein [Mucilaginibacter myungsuensis]MBE9663339.1 ABC transporter ATP-binding protein [Mucilaginibacter myungsuensis]MDN3600074.1 ABC transporter ATP-binding protein [Mucilaginibacter myungsuensis]